MCRLAQVVRLSMAGAVFLTYMLMFYVPCKILIPPFIAKFQSERHKILAEFGMRTALVLFTREYHAERTVECGAE